MATPRIAKIARESLVHKHMDKTFNVEPNGEQSGVVAEGAIMERYDERFDGKRKGTNHCLESVGIKKDGLNGENEHRIFAIVVKIVP